MQDMWHLFYWTEVSTTCFQSGICSFGLAWEFLSFVELPAERGWRGWFEKAGLCRCAEGTDGPDPGQFAVHWRYKYGQVTNKTLKSSVQGRYL